MQDLFYKLTGPFWPEYIVAWDLRRKGWKVYRHFCTYDPKKHTYAEIDILAVSHDGIIFVEVKSYAGRWESLDSEPVLRWRKMGTKLKVKSPVWQVKRARLAFINSLLKDYPGISSSIINATKTYVVLDRGVLINARRRDIRKAWDNMRIDVLPISDIDMLPSATLAVNADFKKWLDKYYKHFRWRWYYHIIRGSKYYYNFLAHLSAKWHKKYE